LAGPKFKRLIVQARTAFDLLTLISCIIEL
jgi:hypothetical protein